MKLVLFDIDGTLLLSGGAGRRAINRALDEVFGAAGSQEHPLDGKTDPQIVRELMRMAGHDDDYIDAHMNELFERYVELLHEEFLGPNHGAYAIPFIAETQQVVRDRWITPEDGEAIINVAANSSVPA